MMGWLPWKGASSSSKTRSGVPLLAEIDGEGSRSGKHALIRAYAMGDECQTRSTRLISTR